MKQSKGAFIKKHTIFLLAVVTYLFLSSPVFSQGADTLELEDKGPDTLGIGMYVFSVYDVDFPANQLNIDFYIWYTFKNDSINPSETFELVNDKEIEKQTVYTEDYGEINYQTFRCNAVVREKWDIGNFPFDEHKIEIIVEDFEDKDNVVFIPDSIGTKLDSAVMQMLQDWEITGYSIREEDYIYETNYGDPTVSSTDYPPYSRVIFEFTIKRKGTGLFIKLFIGLFISILLALITLIINPMDLDPRFGLSVGALFAAIANSFVIASTLPETASFTFLDILHNIAFIYIFACIFISAFSLRLYEAGKQVESRRLDMVSLAVMSGSIVLLFIYFVFFKI